MLKRVKVHIYTVDDIDGYICLDTGNVPMYVSFRRNNEPADWLNTYGGDFHHLTSIVPTLQGGTGSNKYTSYLTGYITIDVDNISRLPEQRRVSLKMHDYLATHYGWEF